MHLEFESMNGPQVFFPNPVPIHLTIHANMSSNSEFDGIKILWGRLSPVNSSPISHLSQTLLKESMKISTFRSNYSEQKEKINKKKEKLISDLEVFVNN